MQETHDVRPHLWLDVHNLKKERKRRKKKDSEKSRNKQTNKSNKVKKNKKKKEKEKKRQGKTTIGQYNNSTICNGEH